MIRLTVRQMEYFEALARTLHFGRAAALAGVSQPALSSQIAEMEEKLGCRLFERGGRTVRLTEEAAALQPRIENLLADLREIERAATQARAPLEGRFRLGIIPTVAPYLLPEILPGIRVYTGGKHTFESQFVGVTTAEGTLILASDNAYLYKNVESGLAIAQTLDAASNIAAQKRMVELAGNANRVIPGHDPSVFTRFNLVTPNVARLAR